MKSIGRVQKAINKECCEWKNIMKRMMMINIWAKAAGTLIGGIMFFVKIGGKFDGSFPHWAFCAGFCALGYMAGNAASAVMFGFLSDKAEK